MLTGRAISSPKFLARTRTHSERPKLYFLFFYAEMAVLTGRAISSTNSDTYRTTRH